MRSAGRRGGVGARNMATTRERSASTAALAQHPRPLEPITPDLRTPFREHAPPAALKPPSAPSPP